MKLNNNVQRWIAGLTLTLAASLAQADIVTIEPDDYAPYTNLSNVAPGAKLSTYRYNGMGSAGSSPVYAVDAIWAPTGTRVFGHKRKPEYHWVNLRRAYSCYLLSCPGEDFEVFRVDFAQPTDYVGVMTTMLSHAIDGAELWAFDATGKRIAECSVRGVNHPVITSGVMLSPVYGTILNSPLVPQTACGTVVIKKNCTYSSPGECDFVVTASIQRIQRDIAFVMWGGTSSTWTTSPVDKLTYNLEP